MARRDFLDDLHAPQANTLVPATSAIINNGKGKILLHRRRDNNLWGLPGGTMEVGESVVTCLKREVKEETGLEVKPLYLVGIYSNPNHVIAYKDGEVRQEFSICFACNIKSGKLEYSPESTSIKFFSKKEIKEKLDIHPSIMQRLMDYWRHGRSANFY